MKLKIIWRNKRILCMKVKRIPQIKERKYLMKIKIKQIK